MTQKTDKYVRLLSEDGTRMTFIERPYKVYAGEQEYVYSYGGEDPQRAGICWTYKQSFREWHDAEAYAERISEDYEFVKIEEKENNGG